MPQTSFGSPKLIPPCLESIEQQCWPQYTAAAFFAVVGFLAWLEAYFVYLSWRGFQNDEREEGAQAGSWGNTCLNFISKFTPVGTRFAPGEVYTNEVKKTIQENKNKQMF